MSLIFRLAGKRCTNQFLKHDKNCLMPFIRPVTLKAKAADVVKEEGHDERNMKLGRPQSPHLTIYSLQLTSLLSITHRFTGMALSGYAIALGLGAVVLPESIPCYIDNLECMELGETAIAALKFLLAFPLTYHFWNGIRHLLWDTGRFLSIREVYVTGYIMLSLALTSAIVLSLM
ncbi:succinate dehydrogenase cytochrome b560 subunit, mitochondrial [Leptinotarsa decemlineata]|uniref:succinate dehydrogenase cytochrome b560 subunit, mitochondrial n=1 Tax=Leptinotarsa decemlineata TaxID=7539 RepID=UPI000C2541FB|nr:succinate dehydrogenase cytochrome b560 subunit, mitochondrial-like [Leptinotarsa decemlineata]